MAIRGERHGVQHRFLGASDAPTDFHEDVMRRAKERKASERLGELLALCGAPRGVNTQPQTQRPRFYAGTDTGLCSESRWSFPPDVPLVR